jgi:hypothetical protein
MDTPPSNSLSSTSLRSPLNLINLGNMSFKAAERSQILHSLPGQQPNCKMITTLSVKMISLILEHIKEPATFFKLSATCRGFKAMVEERYKEEYTALINAAEPLHFDKDEITTTVIIPIPQTDEWQHFRYCSQAYLTGEERIKKIYITAWDLLLQPIIREEKEKALMLMKLLLGLVAYINNTTMYAAILFSQRFPTALFDQLVNHVDLEQCIQLLIQHFPISENSPAYQFIRDQCPFSLLPFQITYR